MAEVNNEKLEQVAKALVWSAWFAAQAPVALSRRNIQLGDMVFEFSTIHEQPYLDKVGTVVGHYVIETLDGRFIRWHNAAFKKVPQGLDFNLD